MCQGWADASESVRARALRRSKSKRPLFSYNPSKLWLRLQSGELSIDMYDTVQYSIELKVLSSYTSTTFLHSKLLFWDGTVLGCITAYLCLPLDLFANEIGGER